MLSPHPRFRFYGSPDNYAAAAAALVTGRVHRGNDIEELEADLARRLGGAHAIAVPQCRVGIFLAIKHLLKPGRPKVVLSPYTIYDVVNMVVAAGGVPVFCDIEAETCNIDPQAAEALIDDETSGVIITHLHGLACDSHRFRALCEERGVWLLEDAAQAFGARIGGQPAGTVGHVGAFSFGRAKNVNGFFGGALVTEDAELAGAIRADLATFPEMSTATLYKRVLKCALTDLLVAPVVFQLLIFWLFRYGCLHDVQSVNKLVNTEDNPARRDSLPESYARRMTPVQARIIRRQLARLDASTEERISKAKRYDEGLRDVVGMRRPPLHGDGEHIYMAYPIQVGDRWAFVKSMMRGNRDLSVQHYNNTADLPCFAEFARPCPIARRVSERVVLLPTYPGYAMSEVEKTIAAAARGLQGASEPADDVLSHGAVNPDR